MCIFLVGSILCAACAGLKSPSKLNFSFLYADSEAHFTKTSLLKSQNGYRGYVLIDPILASEENEDLVIDRKYIPLLAYYKDYDQRKPIYSDTLRNNEYTILPVQQGLLLTFSFPLEDVKDGVLILYFLDIINKAHLAYDIPLPKVANPLSAQISLTHSNGVPVMDSYVNCEDTLILRATDLSNAQLYITYYSQSFKPAVPPMAVSMRSDEQTLHIDTTFAIATARPFRLARPGLYLFQTDTNAAQGFTIRADCLRYPRPSRAQELIDALIYITSTDERSKIQKAVNPKRELDNFWINQGGNKETARQMIQQYYRRVEFANRHFTTFKEGWKTDKGLIYIVFGTPSKVKRNAEAEEWQYPKKSLAGEQRFVFSHRPNLFSPRHHELIRAMEYDIYWYTAVEQIRKGLSESK